MALPYTDLSRTPTIVNFENGPNFGSGDSLPQSRPDDGPKQEAGHVDTPSPGLSTAAVTNIVTVIPTSRRALDHHFSSEVSKSYTNWILVSLFFTSGLIDSVAFNSWSCFVSMQTGKHGLYTENV